MHRQRFTDVVVEQAVIRVRQTAVRLEPGRFARRHDRRQARVLGNHEAPSQRLVDQAYGGHGPETVIVQAQQPHGATVEVFAQGLHQALQSHRIGQLDDQVGGQAFTQHGSDDPPGFV